MWYTASNQKQKQTKQASDIRDAIKKLDEGMKGTMADYIIASVAETAIWDVYPYESEPDVEPEFKEV